MDSPSLFLDMVHHNPGEPPFDTRFSSPAVLRGLGYTGQVFKHLNACVPIGMGEDAEFPATAEEQAWLAGASAERDAEIAAARKAGLEVYYHIDLFLLPLQIVRRHGGELCDSKGRISLLSPAVLELHRRLLEGIFSRYPDVGGLVIRVGENYLYDTPHHGGNTAVPLFDPQIGREEKIRRFVLLLNFLREEVCVKHGKTLIHRTWDHGAHFHSDPDFYLAVTGSVEPHPRLIFSIKHTRGDFYRGCPPNPCLGLGRHRQIVEVQCQREYEGKGAYPNYVARGIIEGFPEVPHPLGLRDWRQSPLWAGVWTWTRGGGWHGPRLRDEFWCDLNTRVLAAWMRDPQRSEAGHFEAVCAEGFGMDAESRASFRQLCLLSEEAVWFGASSPALARATDFGRLDLAAMWMRDDRLGGMREAKEIFAFLEGNGAVDEAVAERTRGAELFRQMDDLAGKVRTSDPRVAEALRASTAYGLRLFRIVAFGWELLARIWKAEKNPQQITGADLNHYRDLWSDFRRLPDEHPLAASLYEEHYFNMPGEPPDPGLTASLVDAAKQGKNS